MISVCVSVCRSVYLSVCTWHYIGSCNCCVLAPFGVKICTRVSCWKLTPAKKFCELLIFHRDFRKNMYFPRFCMHFSNVHFSWKNHHFLFVTLSYMIGFTSYFYRRREIQLPYWICTLKCARTPFPRFFLQTWNFHCTRTSKNWKIHEFFWSFSFGLILFSNSKIVRRTRFCRF